MTINKERKKFELKASHMEGKHELVSTRVRVYHQGVSSSCFIRFSDDFVRFVGLELHRGVSPQTPAGISVYHCDLTGDWFVQAYYIGRIRVTSTVVLWVAKEKPKWVTLKG